MILGHLVPTGTGFKFYHQSRVKLAEATLELAEEGQGEDEGAPSQVA